MKVKIGGGVDCMICVFRERKRHPSALLFFFFWPCHTACRILVPQPGIKPVPLAVEAQSPNYWITREDPFHSVQSLNHVRFFRTPWTAVCQDSLSITNFHSLLKLVSIKSVMPSNHLILSPSSPPAFSLSHHQGLFQ